MFRGWAFPVPQGGSLTAPELERLWHATYAVPAEAVPVLRQRVGSNIHLKVRDFLKVHGKGGQPCPVCGGRLSELRANGRLHNFCRACQPGSLLGSRSFGSPAPPPGRGPRRGTLFSRS
ncbi:MAG: hypothetical protein EXR48_02350 [Dehalococcoidia bacterium]|nr:hypothetical protein [Dehalococcoidia bacterium]